MCYTCLGEHLAKLPNTLSHEYFFKFGTRIIETSLKMIHGLASANHTERHSPNGVDFFFKVVDGLTVLVTVTVIQN